MTVTARSIIMISRPVGLPKATDFRIEVQDLPEPGVGEVLLQMMWLSLDPYMRGRMADGPSYAAPMPLGGMPPSEAVARDAGLVAGDVVVVHDFWRDHAIRSAEACRKLEGARRCRRLWG